MEFRTVVDLSPARWLLQPMERMLLVGSCFSANMGQRFRQAGFRTLTNPFGVMYNPISILHTVERLVASDKLPFVKGEPATAVLTLGTNHIYQLKETGEVVDNCEKRPQNLFHERALSVGECVTTLRTIVETLQRAFPQVRVLLTVSPIRYKKYGFPESQRSKATLILAVQQIVDELYTVDYFPSYEIMMDELRDYRFYASDMLHPSEQAVDYLWERVCDSRLSSEAQQFLQQWKPICKALHHRPFDPESPTHQQFLAKVQQQLTSLRLHFPTLPPTLDAAQQFIDGGTWEEM